MPTGAGDVDMSWFRIVGLDAMYVNSFKIAADRLVADGEYPEGVVITVGHLYRHYLELHLKLLLREARETMVVTISDKYLESTHGLMKLWSRARPVIENDGAATEPGEVSAAEDVIRKIDAIDPSGQESRYSRTTKGSDSLGSLPEKFSLGHFAATMQTLHDFLHEHTLVFTCMSDPNA